ncbi:hypothetical protein PtA15_12A117 [Puccinia triticina]|uniref:Ig-like domain-containing protein n=1 Tax=Puccinia triticina TaxID=208348 RepID=A0ABY7D1A3_9BASI|nr:uncharacterized protein PtA15_12A117 [Puccinia triticina]WAQ90131.1 hypothetical protein PtA15_12A117 [Puccinia triticina]WAR61416.1 hypothetical protein PtB15_12B101 [Puccinia triticina]
MYFVENLQVSSPLVRAGAKRPSRFGVPSVREAQMQSDRQLTLTGQSSSLPPTAQLAKDSRRRIRNPDQGPPGPLVAHMIELPGLTAGAVSSGGSCVASADLGRCHPDPGKVWARYGPLQSASATALSGHVGCQEESPVGSRSSHMGSVTLVSKVVRPQPNLSRPCPSAEAYSGTTHSQKMLPAKW